jgi:putative alpha-1,2-mannosidase
MTRYHCLNIGSELGALLTFAPASGGGKTTILARVGVSFMSRAQACSNANSEIPDYNFEGVRSTNRAQWNELLGRIQVDTTGIPTETVQLFYSSVGIQSFDQVVF